MLLLQRLETKADASYAIKVMTAMAWSQPLSSFLPHSRDRLGDLLIAALGVGRAGLRVVATLRLG
jgi:hypothetical protein